MRKAFGYLLSAGAAAACLSAVPAARGAPVTDFHTFKAAPATTLSGQGTDDPVVGSLTETADASFVIGYLAGPASLTNVGDQIIFRFGVRFNDATGIANAGDNFRFALFDENGQQRVTADNTDAAGVDGRTDNYRGYIFGVRNGSGTGSGGSIRERISMLATGDNAFATAGTNGATAPSLGAVGGDPVVLTSDVNGDGAGADYTGIMTLTRTEAGVDVSGSFIGTNNPTGNSFSASDTTGPFSSTFGAVGFLVGDALNVEQVLFRDVSVTAVPIPEPSSLAVLGLAGLAGLRRRRK